jgi:hypothetical protein
VPAAARPLITVSGMCSGVGKTTLVELLIRRFAPIAALKVTVVDSGVHGCPIDRECGVCAALTVPFRVIHERPRAALGALAKKDTGRYAVAGAAPVIWVQTRGADLDRALAAGLEAASVPADNGDSGAASAPVGIVLEGNTPVLRLDPDVMLVVDRPARRETKPSARALQAMSRPVDWVLVNLPAATPAAIARAARERAAAEWPGVEIVALDLARPGRELDPWMSAIAHRCSDRH